MIPKLILPALFALLLLVLIFASKNAIADDATRVQNLSAIASSISAMIAVVVALWTDHKDRTYRKQALEESEKKQLNSRKRVAALYSAEILAWLDRKDISDVVTDLGNIEQKDYLHVIINLLNLAKGTALSEANATDADLWHAEIEYVTKALRLGVFKRVSTIPSIWTTQFRRDDVDVLDGTAPAYFVVMSTIWTNLNLKAQQLSGSLDSLRSIRKEEADLMSIVVDAIADDAVELRKHITEFLHVAKDGGLILANYPENDLAEALKSSSDLLAKSRDRSQRLSQAWRMISIARLRPLVALTKQPEGLLDEATARAKMTRENIEKIGREAGKLDAAGRHPDVTAENKS